jgi:hypothetical protein
MTDLASLSSVDVGASRTKKIIFGAVLVVVLGALGVVAVKLITDEPGAKACEHLAELRETDPLADQVIDRLVHYVESRVVQVRVVRGTEHVAVGGSTPDERCHAAIGKLDKAMGHGPFTRLVDCIAGAKTARSAAMCL